MRVHVDWISFTIETQHDPAAHMDLYLLARSLIKGIDNGLLQQIFDGQAYEPGVSRTPYRLCINRDDHGVRIYGGSPTGTVLFEMSGRCCERLCDTELEIAVISALYSRLTRLDVAVDIRCTTRPVDFSNARSHKAFRTVSYISSDSGQTCYIGSPKSDRFCRVYRYNPPHPRADLLRVEYVFRKHLARSAGQRLSELGDLAHFASECGNTWGFVHRDWQPDIKTDEKVRVPIMTQTQEDTVAWLYKQVAPAVARLMRETGFDITDWLELVYAKALPDDAQV